MEKPYLQRLTAAGHRRKTDETTKEADTTVPTAEGSTDTTTDTITETTEAETETTTVEEVKPWDLLNNEPLNPTTSGYDELDRLVEGFMNKLKDDGVISDDMSNLQKVLTYMCGLLKMFNITEA